MNTLYLRNVPDDVLDRLKLLSAREGLSVSAMAVRELAESTRRADNAALLRYLPDLEVSISEVVAALDEARTEV
ncbi:MAG: antitoxin [Acidimicrobiia bacterium]|nr:antitoxin [Acidimicrobiia bacterium]